MGRYVGRLIAARLYGQRGTGRFVYRHAGDLAAIGRKAAIVSVGRFRLTGFIGWAFWGLAHIYYLIGARNRLVVALDWLWDYISFQRGARLINECGTIRSAGSSAVSKEQADARPDDQTVDNGRATSTQTTADAD
jgi:NADH dehydrogenase